MRLRIRISGESLNQGAHLASNTVLLATNLYLVGSGFRQQMHNRKRDRIAGNLQLAAEVASATASLAQVVTATLNKHHVQDR